VPGLEFFAHELEWAGSDRVGDLLIGVGPAIRSGIMNGTKLDTLASPSSSSGNGCLSRIVTALSSPPVISSIVAESAWPSGSRVIQRRSEAVQSAPRTGWPSWNLRPGRRAKR
jgi:hypothetical protein